MSSNIEVRDLVGKRIWVPAGADLLRGRMRAYHADVIAVYSATANEHGDVHLRLRNRRGTFAAFVREDRIEIV
jgi:hypothetical protein